LEQILKKRLQMGRNLGQLQYEKTAQAGIKNF
jgi:hypothetical protein